MVRRRVGVWLWVCCVAWSLPCSAQELPASPVSHQTFDVDEVISSRRVPGRSLNEFAVPANVTVITAQEIRTSGASTIQEAIARSEGVAFSDQQGFGLASDGTLNLRGVVNSSRTNALVLVDGIRQNRITGDEVHWQSIPVDQVERIEIIRGGGGIVYGEGALAGVINIMTKQGGEKPLETEAGVERGSFGWQKYMLSGRGHLEPVTYGVNYTRGLVTGYRDSSWARNTTVTTHVGVQPLPGLNGTVHVLHSQDTTAFPGGLTQAQTDARRRQTNAFHGFNDNNIDQVSLDLVAGPWEGFSSVVTLFWRRWIQSSQDSIDFNSFTIAPSRGISARTNSEWHGTWAKNLLVSGVELSEDKATTGDRDAFPGPDSESNRAGYGLYIEDTLTLWDRLVLIGGLRHDRARYHEDLSFPTFEGTLRFQGTSPKFGLTYTLIPETLNVFAAYSRPFKAPNVDDLSARLPSFSGNVSLTPQQADTYELGVRVTKAQVKGEATWFFARTHDEILFNSLTSQNENFDTRRFGMELGLHADAPNHRVRGYTTYTFVNADFRKGPFEAHLVPGTPRHTVHVGIGVSPLKACWVDLDWGLTSDFFRINDMNNALGKAKGYGVLNLLMTYELPSRNVLWSHPITNAYLKIHNLTNAEYVTFQSSNGKNLGGAGQYPMPPITFTGGFDIQF